MIAQLLDQVQEIVQDFGGGTPFYRGQADASWKLLPAFARQGGTPTLEGILYYDFIARAGNLLQPDPSGWSQLFVMQHHGIPTRLMDWTTTFAIALYFAVRDGKEDAAVWILDPYVLNKTSWEDESLPAPGELESDYYRWFVTRKKVLATKVVAISPTLNNPRLFNQRAAFTLHGELKTPLEDLFPDAVRKIVIPGSARTEAKEFLRLAGISEYSLFPDLDGLARDLILENF